eukprot:CAMPEP_0201713606 /NCGR_PEP_ID=MMETSP0593-20130828/384_1 /ASSEMBLY_ACC=CAM_ASM_000672 /TAXON_ID=267983 /ORGANISM="Skeletonema japonicum, Strain CCMP2506" /LENGTH=218 /DNA_ID=CAMNT_0048202779 /DNA_START=155 /DNA_END=811 /DNA_ORIENTATION=-
MSDPTDGIVLPPALPPVEGDPHHHVVQQVQQHHEPAPLPLPENPQPVKRNKKVPLTPREAVEAFAQRGIYVDPKTGSLRCSCNHKPSHKWDLYGYTRHFTFKCHKKYEETMMNEEEVKRLVEAKDIYFKMFPVVSEHNILRKRKRAFMTGEKNLTTEEVRNQEKHWMQMWKDAKDELRKLRDELRLETDEEVRVELMKDIDGLKNKKDDWAKLLGLNE